MDTLQRHLVEQSAGEYRAGRLNRREFLRRLTLITGSTVLALALGEILGCAPAAAPTATLVAPSAAPTATAAPGVTVPPDDPSLEAGPVDFQSHGLTLFGYLARPKAPGSYPAMLIIHENRGLLPHFPDVARRFAKVGYAALALDLLSRQGGTAQFPDSDQARDALGQIPEEHLLEELNSGVDYLQGLPYVQRERVGAIGFCFGGSMLWLLSVRNPQIKAAVPFYGASPPLAEVPNLQAAVLGIYAGNDQRINASVPELEAALKQQKKTYRFITYPGADHAFFNNTGMRYNAEAASAAWGETLAWLEQHLKG
jgi:carboxymethylenebutenolidase